MSDRWPGGIIRSTPVTPTGPGETGSAPGVWTMDQAAYWIKQGLWPTALTRDPYFPYVTMLLSTTSLNGGQNSTFLDTSGNNFTFTNVGSPTQGSFSPYGSNWSGYFDGSGDYLQIANNAALGVPSGDFTFETWIFPTALTGQTYTPVAVYAVNNVSVATDLAYACIIKSNNTIEFSVYVGGTAYRATSTSTISANTWTHIAGVRSGNTLTLYINGTSAATVTISGTINDGPSALYRIGGYQEVSTFYYFTGYISNQRFVKGTALYTSNFTPSTTPLTAVSGTSLLTCGYNRFRDGSTNNFTITVNGDSKTTDFSPFAPASPYSAASNGGSLVFNGSNEATYVDSSNAALTLGTGDFTIELWVYQRVLGGTQSWVSTYGGPGSGYRFSPTNTLQFSWGDSDVLTSSVTTDINQWSHVAVTRSGSTVRIFKNGVVVATGTNSTNLTGGSTQTTLGRIPTYNQWYYNGYMSDVRIVKGTAVYTANFTPPTAPLTAISGTALLAAGANSNIFDATASNDFLTAGNAQSSTTQAKFGTTSIYLDGSGDYLLSQSSPTLALSGASFTIEAWVYVTSSSEPYQHVVKAVGSGGNNLMFIDYSGGSTGVLSSQSGGTAATRSGVTLNTWHHVAVVRNGTSVTCYVNGVGGTPQTIDPGSSGLVTMIVGYDGGSSPARYFNGYIDDLRITNGVARYTANFTPPTAAFPVA